MAKLETIPLPGTVKRYERLHLMPLIEAAGKALPDGMNGDINLVWDGEWGRGHIFMKQTHLATVHPRYTKNWREEGKPVVRIRPTLPAEARTTILGWIESLADTCHEIHKEAVAERRIARQAEAEQAREVVPEPGPPQTLYDRLFTNDDRDGVVADISFPMTMTALGRALAGLEATHDQTQVVFEIGRGPKRFRFMTQGAFMGDVQFEDEGGDRVRMKTSSRSRKVDIAALQEALGEGTRVWNARINARALITSLDALSSLPRMDAYSVLMQTARTRQKHEPTEPLEIAGLTVTGMGMRYALTLRHEGLAIAQIITMENEDDSPSRIATLGDTALGEADWFLSKDLAAIVEMRWRCHAAHLDPDDFPVLGNDVLRMA